MRVGDAVELAVVLLQGSSGTGTHAHLGTPASIVMVLFILVTLPLDPFWNHTAMTAKEIPRVAVTVVPVKATVFSAAGRGAVAATTAALPIAAGARQASGSTVAGFVLFVWMQRINEFHSRLNKGILDVWR